MCNGLIGRKLGMTSVFSPEGEYVPVTVLEVGPCVVTQIKTAETDGYNALQLGFGAKKASRVNRPMRGHLKKSGAEGFAFLREFNVESPEAYNLGQALGPDLFEIGERVDVTGTSKGRGFAGVIKRHNFSGSASTHGSKCHRIPGSVGSSAWPSRVVKGKRLPGHYGHERNTIRNLQVLDVRPGENLVLVRGAVPGPKTGMVIIRRITYRNYGM